jgi:hypothetical protein
VRINALRNKEEQHDAEVAVVRRGAYVHGHEGIAPHILAKPTDKETATSCEATSACTHRMFNHRKSSRNVRPNPWASIAQRHMRYSRTWACHLRTNIFCKSDTLSSGYIIPSHHTTSTSVSNTNSLHNGPSTVISNIVTYSLSIPSQLFSLF